MTINDYEIKYKIELIKSEKWNRLSNLIKSLGFPIISVMLLIAISLPESAFNKSSTEEMLIRERANLLIEILKQKDPEIRNLLIEVLRDFYPSINKRFVEIEDEVLLQSINDCNQSLQVYREQLNNCKECTELEKSNIETNIELYKIKLKSLEKKIK